MENDRIQRLSGKIVEQIIELLHDKVYKIILYGSYARGDFDMESDFDVMILLDCPREEVLAYRKGICKIASRLSLEDEIEVSLRLLDRSTYEKWMDAVVFYQNVDREGVLLYGE